MKLLISNNNIFKTVPGFAGLLNNPANWRPLNFSKSVRIIAPLPLSLLLATQQLPLGTKHLVIITWHIAHRTQHLPFSMYLNHNPDPHVKSFLKTHDTHVVRPINTIPPFKNPLYERGGMRGGGGGCNGFPKEIPDYSLGQGCFHKYIAFGWY